MSLEALNKLLDEPFESLKTDIYKLQRLVGYYIQCYGSVCAGCGGVDKYEEYYYKLKNEGITIMENQANSQFQLKRGAGPMSLTFGSSKFLSPANLTDDLAIEFLANNKKRIANFSKFPEDWEDKVDAFKSAKATEATDAATAPAAAKNKAKGKATAKAETTEPKEEEQSNDETK